MKILKALNALTESTMNLCAYFQPQKPSSLVTIFIFATVIIVSCKKNNVESENRPLSLMEALAKQGYDTLDNVDLGNYYLIEGDILIDKSSSTQTTPRQAINSSSQLVSSAKAQEITVRIDNSMPTDGSNLDWRNEVLQAINEYNGLINSTIHFTYVTTASADITIVVRNTAPDGSVILPNNVIAAAGFPPGDGNPYSIIVVNSNYVYTPVSSGQKKYNMVHELGHCIGLRHTNWYGRGESSAIGVGYSPNTGVNPDATSVFNGGTAANSWNNFSVWDEYAIDYLYPLPPHTINGKLIAYTGNGAVYWGIDSSYRWIRNYETLAPLFGDSPWNLWTMSSVLPSPIGTDIVVDGYERAAFLAGDYSTGKVYLVERKKVNPSNATSPYYNYCRHIYSMTTFDRYKFDASKIEYQSSILFSSSPSENVWILGPTLY